MASRTDLYVSLIALLAAACLLTQQCADAARPLDAAAAPDAAPRRVLQQQQGFWSGMPAPSSTAAATATAIGTITSAAAVAAAPQDDSGAAPGASYSSTGNNDPRVAGEQQFDGAAPTQPQTAVQQPPRRFRTYRGGYRPSFAPQQRQQPATWQQPQSSQQEAAPSVVSSPQQPVDVPSSDAGGASGAAGPSGDMGAVLALHNTLRARHGTAPLAWSDSLAAGAQQWADRCVFQHSNGGGENLAQYLSPTAAVQAWYDEIRMYDYSAGQYSSATGHATQLLWRGSTEVGCGWAASCQYLVCRYSPPGNVLGYFTENVSPPTSR